MNCVITFDSIHRVMRAEKILLENGVAMKLIPTPRHISSDCGMVVEVDGMYVSQAKRILIEHDLRVEGIYEYK
jgi:hypothetical protein